MERFWSKADFPRIMQIETKTQSPPWALDTFEQCFKAGFLGWVIEEENTVVGFIIVSMQLGEGHILNLCIDPDFQRMGLGRHLLNHALDNLRTKGAMMAFLEVRKSNNPAKNLYESLGFTQIGERKNYYATPKGFEDALVFAKDLSVK